MSRPILLSLTSTVIALFALGLISPFQVQGQEKQKDQEEQEKQEEPKQEFESKYNEKFLKESSFLGQQAPDPECFDAEGKARNKGTFYFFNSGVRLFQRDRALGTGQVR